MKVDRDFIPLFLIAACVAIWFSANPWNSSEAIQIAGDILKVSFGGVLGYMVKTVVGTVPMEDHYNGAPPPQYHQDGDRVNQLLEENQRLNDELQKLKEFNGLWKNLLFI